MLFFWSKSPCVLLLVTELFLTHFEIKVGLRLNFGGGLLLGIYGIFSRNFTWASRGPGPGAQSPIEAMQNFSLIDVFCGKVSVKNKKFTGYLCSLGKMPYFWSKILTKNFKQGWTLSNSTYMRPENTTKGDPWNLDLHVMLAPLPLWKKSCGCSW